MSEYNEDKLSHNFKLSELLQSSTAERHLDIIKTQYNPPMDVLDNLNYLCDNTLQPIREALGVPLRVTSGYRCKALNDLVGSSDRSQHLQGQAADIQMSDKYLPITERFAKEKAKINKLVRLLTGSNMRRDVNANFYLFCYIVINLANLDIDQVIHEYGEGPGNPGWIHVSSSSGCIDKRQSLFIGKCGDRVKKSNLDLISALRLGT